MSKLKAWVALFDSRGNRKPVISRQDAELMLRNGQVEQITLNSFRTLDNIETVLLSPLNSPSALTVSDMNFIAGRHFRGARRAAEAAPPHWREERLQGHGLIPVSAE